MAKAAAVVALALFFAVVAAVAQHLPPQCDIGILELHCHPAFDTGALPTEACCVTLRTQEQDHCICQYARDPAYGDYFNRHGVQVTIMACGLPVPFPGC